MLINEYFRNKVKKTQHVLIKNYTYFFLLMLEQFQNQVDLCNTDLTLRDIVF